MCKFKSEKITYSKSPCRTTYYFRKNDFNARLIKALIYFCKLMTSIRTILMLAQEIIISWRLQLDYFKWFINLLKVVSVSRKHLNSQNDPTIQNWCHISSMTWFLSYLNILNFCVISTLESHDSVFPKRG